MIARHPRFAGRIKMIYTAAWSLEDVCEQNYRDCVHSFYVGSAVYAQVPGGNVYFGYSYMSADLVSNNRTSMNGWNGSIEGKVLPFIGIVADFSGEVPDPRLWEILHAR